MSASAKLRLVRCPKCENLLPELADYSVYQCGGCGTVLRAKVRNKEEDSLSYKSDEDGVVGSSSSTKSMNTPEKGTVDFSDASDVDFKSSPDSLPGDLNGSEKDKVEGAEKCEEYFNGKMDKWGVQKDLNLNTDKSGLSNSMGVKQVDLNVQMNSITLGSGREVDWQKGETCGMEGVEKKNSRDNMESVRFSTSNHDDRTNYRLDFVSGVQELLRNRSNASGADKVKHLEQDRLELLRKLDELKDQLGQSCNLVHNPSQMAPVNSGVKPTKPFYHSGAWPMDGSSGSNPSQQLLGPEKCVAGPSFSNYCPEPFPLTNVVEMPTQSYYPSIHNPNNTSHFEDHFGSQMLRRNSCQFSCAHQQHPHQYHSGHYVGTGVDPFNHYPPNPPFHQPSCSCFQCQNRYSQAPALGPGSYYNRRFPDVPNNNPSLYSHENSAAYAACVNNIRTTNPPLNFRDRQAHSRWPTDFSSEIGGVVGSCPRRTVLVSGGRNCYPVAGGAPFLTCNNCFEMLQLPKKLMMVKNQQSVRCGACSTVINFTVINKRLVFSNHSQADPFALEVDDSDGQPVRGYNSKFNGYLNRTNFSSDDYDNTVYDFESPDREPVLQPVGAGLSKHQEMQSSHPSSSSTSEDEDSPDVLTASRDATKNLHNLIKNTRSPPLPGSPLQSYFDYSSNNQVANRFGKGNRSSRSDQENVKPHKVTSRQNSLKEASLATEMDVTMNDYCNTVAFQESQDASKEDNQPKANKGGESFFASIIKKSFRSNQADERSKSNVSVNGHLIPYRVVKKAEKLAGPILPGKYWYDARAGFWGVMGGPCLGIIPPFIEEFDYPMPENCAGGNSGVFVNGRELHQKDLDLLASRGLPTSKDRSYIIEISGRVLDEDTGEELEGLGKLAPTVEKVKHGFGMKVPRTAC
ncbi:DUF3133 domain-containing protein [Cucumis melo var. makuwa]|uniref:DUF3133 domain-containing protein n=1 Tax=Cucumis melo var. makuwa TaxID=1194695 RepID=A0A5A7U116_CUCMM|nr:DUF3133 domain-containing protein [Cucumis melo var. makuwa]